MLTLSTRIVDGVTTLKCRGRMVRGEEQVLLCAAIRAGEHVVLDLSEVEAIDAAGVGLLISLQAAGVYLTLLNPSEAVRRVLLLTGVDSVLNICDSDSGSTGLAISGRSLESAVPVAV